MHFRTFFYRDYFAPPLKLGKPLTDQEAARNKTIIERRNNDLINGQLPQNALTLLQHSLPAGNALSQVQVTTTYPGLIIGIGYEHEIQTAEGELKLGFHFDHTTGLPCIPGSSIKGVLRSFFPQYNNKDPFRIPNETDERKGNKKDFIAAKLGWQSDQNKALKVHQLELALFEGIDLANTQIKRKTNPDAVEYLNIYKRCCFYNAYISRAAADNKIFELDTITPHTEGPLKNPKPLNFLKIRPGVTFTIPMQLQKIVLPDNSEITATQLKPLFKAIITLNGLGAKTNTGYGQFA